MLNGVIVLALDSVNGRFPKFCIVTVFVGLSPMATLPKPTELVAIFISGPNTFVEPA